MAPWVASWTMGAGCGRFGHFLTPKLVANFGRFKPVMSENIEHAHIVLRASIGGGVQVTVASTKVQHALILLAGQRPGPPLTYGHLPLGTFWVTLHLHRSWFSKEST